ncbi:alpha/beta hydrolase [Pseudomonas sp. JS3066]|jgi:arylformamidase|uniref:alpha/beta hydrolase n=1 Tax=unclassified Pseudomonas TaxID=196821 RepID=UPI00129E8084|nr:MULTISPECIES: alpha/beta hydrolase [unclassified Pseudomonas]MDH4652700.1 alpha/beta hydrolase [Pseudomonas sp. BN606]MRK20464.1 alpha/beta hydrolase [Pseudomonas sp. JG-B]WVK91746.1 alpha/beta hydrolase [Pseudomonas sp. JS3066]
MTRPSDPAELAAYYDVQYNARASVEDFDQYPRQYRALSDSAHASLKCFKDVSYGPGTGERLDIFPAEQPNAPVLLFIHGGYWRALSKADSAFMAPALTAAGACVVVLDYDLAPAVTLDHIVDQTRRSLAWLHRHIADFGGDPQLLYASGSSAGGHLTGMLLAGGWHGRYGVPDSVLRGALPISGLFDLRPLLETHINGWMGMDEAAARRNSPTFHLPTRGAELVISYGAQETAEFARQSHEFLDAWIARGLPGRFVAAPGKNHFDVVLELGQPGTQLYRAVCELMGLNG